MALGRDVVGVAVAPGTVAAGVDVGSGEAVVVGSGRDVAVGVAVLDPASNTATSGVAVGSVVVATTLMALLVGPGESDVAVSVGGPPCMSLASTCFAVRATAGCMLVDADVSMVDGLTIVTLGMVVMRATDVPRIVTVGVAVADDAVS